MPQMSPMWWTFLLIFNMSIVYILMTSIYFIPNMNKEKSLMMKIKKFNWSW